MKDDDKPASTQVRPTIEGYLGFRNVAEGGGPAARALESETTRAFMTHFFREKPPSVHYQEAHWRERELAQRGDAVDRAEVAVTTGKRLAEMEQGGRAGKEGELLFDARRAAVGSKLDALRREQEDTMEQDEVPEHVYEF